MKKHILKWAGLATFLLFLFPNLSKSQGFQVNLQGQKQIGMGGAGAGTSLDAASIVYNPGAVSFLKGNSVMGGISPLILGVAYAGASPSSYRASFTSTSPPFSAYAVFGPASNRFKYGIGIYTPFGGSAKWGNAWAGKFVLESLKLRSVFIQPTISYKLTDKLGLGLGFIIATGTVDLSKAIPVSDANGNDGQAELKGNATGYGFNGGLYYQVSTAFSLGLSYRSAVNIKTKNGTANFTVPSSLSAQFPAGNTFSNTLNLPGTLSLGAGLQASPRLLLSAEVNYVNWSRYKNLAFTYAKTTAALQNSSSPRNYTDSYDLRLGGQYAVCPVFFIRAGIAYGATPVKSGYVTPEAPDANRIEFSAGIGYHASKNFTVDASFLYVDILKRTQTNLETNFGGTFKTTAYIPGISLAYHF